MHERPTSLEIYRRLLNLYPAGFRDTYAGPMEQEFRNELAESNAVWAVAVLWVRLLTDLAVTIPRQVVHEFAQDSGHTIRLWLAYRGTQCSPSLR
jgi:hypothetical protein